MKVAVLMSTYNGDKYLKEQIDSIIAQKDVEVELFIRDDGSNEKTVSIITEYEIGYPNIRFINKENVKNIGIRDSFFSLIEYAFNHSDAEYFAFADQDDVWLPEKLISAILLMDFPGEDSKGCLYYSNKTFVDEKLKVISKESIPYYDDYIEVFWKNRASGCTMVFDRNLSKLILKKWPETNCIHDGRIYRVAKSVGSKVVFDENSYILYRQHETNSVGIKGASQYHNSIKYWIKRFVPMLFEKRNNNLIHFLSEIYNDYETELTDEARMMLDVFLKYRTNFRAKSALIHEKKMKKRPRKDRMIWTYRVLFNWMP